MSSKYALSIEHGDVRRLFLKLESDNGGIEAFNIKLKSDVPTVWNPAPSGTIKAHKVEFKGVEGFMFMNEHDNYARFDFYTEDYLSEAPEFIGIETPETTRTQNLMAAEQRRKEAFMAKQAEQDEKYRRLREKLIKHRYEDCQKVNAMIGPVYDLPSFDEYRKKMENRYLTPSSRNPLLESIEAFISKYGKKPELIVPNLDSTQKRLRALSDQLKQEEFKEANGFYVKVQDSGSTATISVLDKQDNLISFMKAPWESSRVELDFYVDVEYEKTESEVETVYSLDFENAVHVEYGRKTDYDDLRFPELFEVLTDMQFVDFKGSDWSFDMLAEVEPYFEIEDFTSVNAMDQLLGNPSVLEKVKGVIESTPAPSSNIELEDDALSL